MRKAEVFTSSSYVSATMMSVDFDELDKSPVRCAVCGRFVGKSGPLAIAWRKGRYVKMRHHDCAPSDTRREREHGEP